MTTRTLVIEGDKSGFNSKNALEKFKATLKANPDINTVELGKYIKPEYVIEILDKNNDMIKVNIDLKSRVDKVREEKERREKLKSRLKLMRNDRSNKDYHMARMSPNVPDDILREYHKLKKMSTVPIPEPSSVLSNPDEYKPILAMVLGNTMMKQLGRNHPYVRYFTLLAEKLGVTEPLPMPTQDFLNSETKLPNNIENLMNMSGPAVSTVVGNQINDEDTDTDTEDE